MKCYTISSYSSVFRVLIVPENQYNNLENCQPYKYLLLEDGGASYELYFTVFYEPSPTSVLLGCYLYLMD